MHYQLIAKAVRAGVTIERIEETIIDRAPLDEEHKSALWLYAQALCERRRDGMLIASTPWSADNRSW
jgi:hypothetical protein